MIVVKNSENPVELPLGKISGCKLLVVFCTDTIMSGNTMGALARIWFLMGPYLLAEKVLGRSVILSVNINIC